MCLTAENGGLPGAYRGQVAALALTFYTQMQLGI